VRTAVIAIAVAYFALVGLGIYLLVDGYAGPGETVLIAAMAGGWFGSRWIVRRARERDER
jgi:hypothetical protein